MRIRLVLFLTLLPTSLFCMKQKEVNLEESKKEILAAFEEKKAVLAGWPLLHRTLKSHYSLYHAHAVSSRLKNMESFFQRFISEGFLSPPHEIQVFYNALHQNPKSSGAELCDVNTTCDMLSNTSLFFSNDRDEFIRDPENGFASRTFLKQLCCDPRFIDIYNQAKKDSSKSYKIISHLDTILTTHGVILSDDPGFDYATFVHLNEANETLHNPQNFSRMKQLLMGVDILNLGMFSVLGEQEEMKKLLTRNYKSRVEELASLSAAIKKRQSLE